MYKRKTLVLMAAYSILVLMAFVKETPKKLFLLGDSISLQYGPYLEKYLNGKFVIVRKDSDSSAFRNLDIPVGSNGGDSRMVLNFLRTKINDPGFQPGLLVLNCGLHDVKRDRITQKIAVSAKEYRNNLEEIYRLISGKKIPMIWINTTGIIDSIHRKNSGFDRYEKDVEMYNAIADEVFTRYNVPEIDLFSFTAKQGNKRYIDHAHYVPEVRALQAAYIAGFIQLGDAENKKRYSSLN